MKYILVQKGDLGYYGHPFVDIKIIGPNGKKIDGRGMLDTGSHASGLNHKVIKKFGYARSDKVQDSYTFNGVKKEKWYRDGVLEFGDYNRMNWSLRIPEFMSIKTAGYGKHDVLIGMDIISLGKLEISGTEFEFYLDKFYLNRR